MNFETPPGENIHLKNNIVYLGSLLSSDEEIMSEINWSLRIARKDFEVLLKHWKCTI